MNRILLIQTAFLGDAVLATALLEELKVRYPQAQLDYLIRKGNESLFDGNPRIRRLLIWDKKEGKYKNLFKLLRHIRSEHYDMVINIQRFAATGFLTAFSGAKERVGFDKNPFSFMYTRKEKHEYGIHEVERNLKLIEGKAASGDGMPRLYPQKHHFEKVEPYQASPYITIAPASVWYTKQFPKEKWAEFLETIDYPMTVIFVGAPNDYALGEEIEALTKNEWLTYHNLCGDLKLLETAALMKGAKMNYTNDSGPMHIASAMNAPVRAIFCSTVEEFGFGPLSRNSKVIQTTEKLSCRPCGVHGQTACPEGHFKCAKTIQFTLKD